MSTALGFGLYLVVLAALAWRASRTAGESEDEYYLAGRSLGPLVVALSAVASGRSAWLMLGLSGLAYAHGVSAVWFLPGYILAELWLFVGPGRRLRRRTGEKGDVTVGDYLASRFPDRARALQGVFAITMVVFLAAYVAGQLVGGAKAMHQALGGGEGSVLVWLAGISVVVLVYVVAGGFRAVSWTDVAQGALMLFALVVLPAAAIVQFGGLRATIAALGPLADPLHKGGAWVITGLAVGLGSPGQPHILVRYMSARDESGLRRAALIGTTWNVVMGWGALMIGLAARVYYGNAVPSSDDAFTVLAAGHLPGFLFGLVLAALLAAVMSTVDSQVLVVASALTRDLRRALRRPDLPARRAARIGRIASTCLVLAAMVLGGLSLMAEGDTDHARILTGLVNEWVLFAWGGLGAAIGPPVLLSLYRRHMSGTAALAAMLTGGITACVWRGLVKPAMTAMGPDAPAWWPWVSYELVVAFPLALGVGLIITQRRRVGGQTPDQATCALR